MVLGTVKRIIGVFYIYIDSSLAVILSLFSLCFAWFFVFFIEKPLSLFTPFLHHLVKVSYIWAGLKLKIYD